MCVVCTLENLDVKNYNGGCVKKFDDPVCYAKSYGFLEKICLLIIRIRFLQRNLSHTKIRDIFYDEDFFSVGRKNGGKVQIQIVF